MLPPDQYPVIYFRIYSLTFALMDTNNV